MMENIRKNEAAVKDLSEADLMSVAAFRICGDIGLSSNYNDEATCFNGAEIQASAFGEAGQVRACTALVFFHMLIITATALTMEDVWW